VAEVEKALQALSTGRRLELHTVPLVRAVMPLLHAWNRAQDNQYAALLDALEKAIGPASDAAVPQPADAF
jgi:hypothetical protein